MGQVRGDLAHEWEWPRTSEVFWGERDKECDHAGWARQTMEHFALAKGMQSGALDCDLDKVSERVDREVLVQEAEAVQFPLALAVAACQLYAVPRMISFMGAVSTIFEALGTILAGCSLATTLARVLLYRLLVRVAASRPSVALRNVVDDVSGQALGASMRVAQQLGQAGRELADGFAQLRLVLSVRKTWYLASSQLVADGLEAIWKPRRFAR